ncbi:MAG: DUF839 domain-containing protein [Candidatus Competibacteraceae bacterium]|nr:DUF839 domain-containing protein [Candidatus Competibacteraceae bacterium]MCB1820506.1 DUF839 domain-containing protein [Candidatus Competibacteraceae bacterium]
MKVLTVAVLTALGIAGCGNDDNDAPAPAMPSRVRSVEFTSMPAPATDNERASAYTASSVTVTYSDGAQETSTLSFKPLYSSLDTITGVTGGQVYDVNGNVLLDINGNPFIANTPDANSLIKVDGAPATELGGNPLYLVTHFEYISVDSSVPPLNMYGKAPMVMKLSTLDQNPNSGELSVVALKNIDMAGIRGLWIPCAGSLSPWNTHLGSEEYEPDARCLETNTCAEKFGADSYLAQMFSMNTYFGDTTTARPYNYGLVPEVTVQANGSTNVVAHRVLGRVSRELTQVMPDQRTAYQGDDGTYTMLTMFVADKAGDLSAGSLYAATWNQTSDANGGAATLTWHKLGSATDAELDKMVNQDNIQFSDIFDTADEDTPGFVKIKAGHEVAAVEWLRVRPGMEKAAAFLETRRYAAYVGATTEFEKFEGVTVNAKDKKAYVAMTRMRSGMEPSTDATVPDDIRLPKNGCGAVYELNLSGGQKDAAGESINSDYVATDMKALVVGEDMSKDAVGNTCVVGKIASPDNLKFSEKMRVLFIGEDSGAHINNFLWAYHVDSGKLARILSIPAGAESTGLQAIDNVNGFAYIMSNFQHPGDFPSSIDPALKERLIPLINAQKGEVGYISGLPELR